MSERDDALRSWFLGPRAENAELFEKLITEALRDHVFWRRNHRPEDGVAIRETDKFRPDYQEAVATLSQELLGLLAQLKKDVPFFSSRYQGHMIHEPTIASWVGYFATMLYNPNNVSIDAAPVTTRLELEVAADLSRMLGYDPKRAFGHLTSGGTVANFEALWVARNITYLPVAAAGAARDLGIALEVARLDGTRVPLTSLSLSELLNVRAKDALDLWELLMRSAPVKDVYHALEKHSLAALGYQGYSAYLEDTYHDPLPASVVLVASAAHYSWEKIVRALGIGSNQLVFVPMDRNFRMDPDALWETVKAVTSRRIPIQALVSICGSTEEGAVDRLDRLVAVRTRAEKELGVTFHLHSDACYGGYAASVTWRANGQRRTAREVAASLGGPWLSEEWLSAYSALSEADSITVDPHKLGYVPYPAGAILFRDKRSRDLVAVDPPYLIPAQGRREGTLHDEEMLGRYIFEGSKPGAAAASVWLSHKVVPLDERGHGHLVERTVAGARRLYDALATSELGRYRVVLLPPPDLNIVCYLVMHDGLKTLAEVNAFNEAIYRQLSPARPDRAPDLIITRTHLCTPMYDGAVDPLLVRLGCVSVEEWRAAGPAGLVVLRSTVMDPFFVSPPPAPDHVTSYLQALREACDAAATSTGSMA